MRVVPREGHGWLTGGYCDGADVVICKIVVTRSCFRGSSLLSDGPHGVGAVLVFDCLIDHSPKIVDKMRRIRSGHPNLSEQDSSELFVWVGVR